jgi:hypothetical protein
MNNDSLRRLSVADDCSVRESDGSSFCSDQPSRLASTDEDSRRSAGIDALLTSRALHQGTRTGFRFLHYYSASTFT